MKILGHILLVLIRAYQLLVSPFLPASCRYHPTCSAYGLEAIRRHGALAGLWLTLRRLLRCHPWAGWGYDPVPGVPPEGDLGRPLLRDGTQRSDQLSWEQPE
jgi:putative membrane protein insertion efficiency factor